MGQNEQREIKRVACPASLRTPLHVFRVGHGNELHYRVADDVGGAQYSFEPWQFFVLEILPQCEDFAALASAFEARFGKPLAATDASDLFAKAAKQNLFSAAAMDHPLVAALQNKQAAAGGGVSGAAKQLPRTTDDKKAGSARVAPETDESLLPGVSEVAGMDDSAGHYIWTLFNPKVLLRLLYPLFLPLKYANYLMPLLLLGSFIVMSGRIDAIVEDLSRPGIGFVKYLLVSLVILNLLVALTTALVAHGFRASVRGCCVHFGVLPSITVRIGDFRKLSRRGRMWLHAAPLLTRMGLFGVGILLWYITRTVDGIWAPFGLALAVISALSFLLAANPLMRSSAYHLVSAYLEESYIRRRSWQVLLGKLRGSTYTTVDGDVLAAYSLVSATYALAVIGMLLLLLGRAFNLHMGAYVFLPLVIIGVPVVWRTIGKFKELARNYERKTQFQRWRKGDLPKGEVESDGRKQLSALTSYSLRAFGLMFLVGLFLPFDHEIGGRFVVLPREKQDVTSEVSGIVETINYDGGEFLRRGTVIGRLSCTDFAAQVKILTAKIAEQDAVVAELKSRPRPEEVRLAESNLRTEETRARFSKEELARMEKLYAEKTVSFEDLEDVRREQELDVKRVAESRANLDLIKAGATPDQIAAAVAKLQSWEEERQLYLEKIEKSVFYMPINGTLVATQLKQKVGSYFERGQSLAVVENTEQVIVQIDITEDDIGFVRDKAEVRVRFPTYFEQDIEGTVMSIGPTVTEGRTGRVLQITAQIDNRDGRLKSGMEGYAKISSESLPLWKVLSLGVIRFFNLEAWSWLP